MRHTVKKYLIPHKDNDFKPHLLREQALTILFCAAIMLFAISLGSSFFLRRTNLGASVLPAVLVDLTNEHRIANNELPLTVNSKLEEAASLKAKDMNDNQYFAHTSPAGVTPWGWFVKAGYNFVYAGENLAINFTESSSVEDAWIKSPTHHANLISEKFNEIGIATYQGIYKGRSATYVVQLFGRRPQFNTSLSLGANAIDSQNDNFEPNTVTLLDEPTFAVAQNIDEIDSGQNSYMVRYSTLAQRLLAKQPQYIQYIYFGLIGLIALILIWMTAFEFRSQNLKNIIWGIIFILVLAVLSYFNSSLIVSFI